MIRYSMALVMLLFVGASSSGCVSVSTPPYVEEILIEKVGKMAAFDLNCPREELSVTKIDEGAYGVTGCGRRASYVGKDGWCDDNHTTQTIQRRCRVIPLTLSKGASSDQ